jgi:predicted AlkP superfamily pyrophosphatase or phosphodiesterase
MRLLVRPAMSLFMLFGAAAAMGQGKVKHVIIVSWDGGKPAVMQQSNIPNVKRMIKEGAGTWQAETILPCITLPSHTSMVSGVLADKHKIYWNDYKKDKPNVTVPTIFSIATSHKMTAAAFVGKEKFKHWDVPGTLTKFQLLDKSSPVVAKAAAAYIQESKPNICFVHFPDTDSAGHKFGWGSKEQIKAMEDQDAAMQLLFDAVKKADIEDSTVFILSADHGGHAKTHYLPMPEDQNIPWIVCGPTVKKGYTVTQHVKTTDTAATTLWLLGLPIPESFDGKPVCEAFEGKRAAEEVKDEG